MNIECSFFRSLMAKFHEQNSICVTFGTVRKWMAKLINAIAQVRKAY